MPDKYQEVIIALIAGTITFFVVTVIMVYIALFYQKKKFQHREQLSKLEKDFSEALLISRLEVQEQSSDAISKEIHDNVGQILSLVKIQLNIISENYSKGESILNEAKENIRKAMTDLRDISKSLSTDRIQLLSLPVIVGQEIDRINRSGVLLCEFSMKGIEKSLNNQAQLILFRIIQECIQNVIKHAKASKIIFEFSYEDKQLVITIKDNGIGFNTAETGLTSDGLGLQNIRSRTQLLGGTLSVASIIDLGTTISLIIPYD